MAIKEYRVQQANMRPIYRRPVRMVQNLVGDKPDKKEAARLPLAEGQAPIAQQGASPRYDAGSLMGLVSSLRSPGEANTAFDPNKPIGGENVPYKGTSGIGGVFSRFFGNRANELNVEAQQGEAARLQDKAAKEEERKFELEKIAESDKGPAAREAARLKYMQDKDIRDEIAREDELNLQLAREGEKDILSDIDMARKEEQNAEDRALRTRALDIQEKAIKPARYSPIGNTGMFQTPEGELAVFEPEVIRLSDKMPGRAARFRMLTGEGSKAPGRSMGDVEVDRVTNKPVGGAAPSPTAAMPEAPNTALFPTMGRAIGESTTEATTAVTDPLRAVGTDIYKALFSSGAQQDPEVLKRIKEREARRANTQPRFNVPLGY